MNIRLVIIFIALVSTCSCDSGPGSVDLMPEVPILHSPQNGSVGEGNSVYLEWRKSDNATNYQIQVSKGAEFTSLESDRQVYSAGLITIQNLEVGTTYYWRIRAFNDEMTSDWSELFWFKPASILAPPKAPLLEFPSHEQIDLPSDIEFRWQAVPDARFYHIQASQSADFYNMEANMESLSFTTQRVSRLIDGYTYFWHVRSQNAAGVSSWSPTWTIVIADSNSLDAPI